MQQADCPRHCNTWAKPASCVPTALQKREQPAPSTLLPWQMSPGQQCILQHQTPRSPRNRSLTAAASSQHACPPRTHSWPAPLCSKCRQHQYMAPGSLGAAKGRVQRVHASAQTLGTAQCRGLCSLCLLPTKSNTPRPNDCRCQPCSQAAHTSRRQ